jgi:hypothetical protein
VTPLGVSGGNQTGGALQDTEGRTGGGGTSQSGGTPGNDQSIGRSAPATAGSLGQGGNGALGPGGGGGGGGWYGGGGGGGGYLPGTPRTPFGVSFTGGGGSSLAVTALWTSVNYRKGVRYGNGVVIIQIFQWRIQIFADTPDTYPKQSSLEVNIDRISELPERHGVAELYHAWCFRAQRARVDHKQH